MTGAGLSSGQAGVEHVEVGDQRPGEGTVRRLDDHQRDARNLAFPVCSDALDGLGVLEDEDRPDVVGERPSDVDGLDHRPVDPGHRDDDSLLAAGCLGHEVGADAELAGAARVLAVDEQHHQDEGRDEDHDEPGPVAELDARDDDQDDPGQDRADRVDRRPARPSPMSAPGTSA